MTRNALSFVLGVGMFGGLLVQSASAEWFANSSLDQRGVRTACGPNGRDGSSLSGRAGYVGNGYAYRDDYRHDNARYGNYGSARSVNWDGGRYANGGYNDSYNSYETRFNGNSRGCDSYGHNTRPEYSTGRFDYRGADHDYRYDHVNLDRRSSDRWSPRY